MSQNHSELTKCLAYGKRLESLDEQDCQNYVDSDKTEELDYSKHQQTENTTVIFNGLDEQQDDSFTLFRLL